MYVIGYRGLISSWALPDFISLFAAATLVWGVGPQGNKGIAYSRQYKL